MTSRVLTIGGIDLKGKIGILADIKVLSAFQVEASSIITSSCSYKLPSSIISKQLNQLLTEGRSLKPTVIRIGIIPTSRDFITEIAAALRNATEYKLVVDTATISLPKADQNTIKIFRNYLLPMATIHISTVDEAQKLLGKASDSIRTQTELHELAKGIAEFGARYVLVKGTNMNPAAITDANVNGVAVLYDSISGDCYEFTHHYANKETIPILYNALSAAIAAGLVKTTSVYDACEDAMYYINKAVRKNTDIVNLLHPLKTPWNGPLLKAVKANLPIGLWDKYVNHPFVRGMAKGTLEKEAFIYFLKQDFLYLQNAARAAALAVNKYDSMDSIQKAVRGIYSLTDEVQYVHLQYCAKWGISKEEVLSTQESVYNIAYTRFLMDKAASGDLLDAKMAFAPCMLGYHEIALQLLNDPATKRDGNPYWDWISQYASDQSKKSYAQGVAELEELAEKYIGSIERFNEVCKIFEQATKLEIMFWEQYNHRAEDEL
ncbi:hypothetical protein BDF20DRAFT_1000689 [Mycotypha africana]|uniref:uncharacterized protein n=1 Tax=Mycotypha africana TaxID=64632 RepID=UPI0022FFF05C|nr:uncharacterized protein BDF20DRAFT_1000689 [Mycotypha africana]KAI8979360.1 hypothetical protein BDF20DRAFT_1000689 [Mycotypha africana]